MSFVESGNTNASATSASGSRGEGVSSAGPLERLAAAVVQGLFSKIRIGHLVMRLPDGTVREFGDKASPLQAEMNICRWRFFTRCASNADIGFGEAYVEEDWTSPDLHAVLLLFLENQPHMNERGLLTAKLRQVFDRFRHMANRNSLHGSRKNISFHYDLSNEFYKLMLDPTMTYSCAIWRSEEESLEQAQVNKIRSLLNSLDLKPGEHLLEVGSGWGQLAIMAAKEYGVKVTTVTLSEQQLGVVRDRVASEGLQDQVEARLQDYRKVEGSFDKIVSVEMIEAVGHEFLGTYFATLDRLLKPNGIVAIQVITMPEERYGAYIKAVDWIQKYIFPGAVCPSLTAMASAMARDSKLMIEEVRNIGPHYARTLNLWRSAVAARWPEMKRLGFDDRFRRMWEYYLVYCEVGFEVRQIGTLQLTLTRPHNTSLGMYRSTTLACCGK